MSKLFLTNVDLSQNELQNARQHNLAAAPASPALGQTYYNTAAGRAYVFTSAGWELLTPQTGSELLELIRDVDGAGSGLNADLLDGYELGQILTRGAHTGTQAAATIHDFDAQVRTSRLDQMAVPTSPVGAGGQRITNVAAPTQATDAATKGYVDGVATGLDFKQEVIAATTGNINLSSFTGAVDGYTVQTGDRILVRAQTSVGQNGIYVFNGTGFTAAPDFNTSMDGAFVYVSYGTTYGNTAHVWRAYDLLWSQFSGASSLVAGAGLSAAGNVYNVGAGTGISVEADNVGIDKAVVARKAAFAVGGATSQVLTHNLGTRDVQVTVVRASAPYDHVECDVESTTANTATVRFATAPAANAYRALVVG